MRILLIDNYDSFVFNLLHLIKKVSSGSDSVDVILNDHIDSSQASRYDSIIISPGPGIPSESGNILSIIENLYTVKPILGICLGHQAIAEVFGADLVCNPKPLHGVQTSINIFDHSSIFKNIGNTILAGRYHSWFVEKETIPDTLQITASDQDGNVMALSHNHYNVFGVQFHPESFMTEYGSVLMKNFLSINDTSGYSKK